MIRRAHPQPLRIGGTGCRAAPLRCSSPDRARVHHGPIGKREQLAADGAEQHLQEPPVRSVRPPIGEERISVRTRRREAQGDLPGVVPGGLEDAEGQLAHGDGIALGTRRSDSANRRLMPKSAPSPHLGQQERSSDASRSRRGLALSVRWRERVEVAVRMMIDPVQPLAPHASGPPRFSMPGSIRRPGETPRRPPGSCCSAADRRRTL